MNDSNQQELFDDHFDGDTPAEKWQLDSDKRALDELFTRTLSYRSSGAFNDLLQFVSYFRFYAPFNAMLVHIQKPGARFVAPPHRWLKDYGRTVKPGAQPLVILQPMGPVMFVFDSSDTEGRPLPPDVENPFAVRSGRIGKELGSTIENVKRDGVRITQVPYGSQMAGSMSRTRSPGVTVKFREEHEIPLRFEMTLNDNHSQESQYATLVHELAHLYCGHLGTPNDKWWPDRRGLPKGVREFEAESVAYVVCRRLGIDPKSEEYLSGYVKSDGEVPPISLECVMKVAGLIEQMGKQKLKQRKT